MMTRALRSPKHDTQPPAWQEASISLNLGNGHYLLDDGSTALQAASCLLSPQEGDRVLFINSHSGDRYILHLLARPQAGPARLHIPGATGVSMAMPTIELQATEQLTLTSLGDTELSAPVGRVHLTARDLTITVLDNLLQLARHMIGRYENWLTEARGLSHLHGKDTQMTAEQDVRVDAERISIG